MPNIFLDTHSCFEQLKDYFPMLATLVIGTAFKETLAAAAFLFFFTTLTPRGIFDSFFNAAQK